MTNWQKMTPEQQAKQKERGKIWRWKKRAAELGISFEEYAAQRGAPKTKAPVAKVKKADADGEIFNWKPVDISHLPEERMIKSDLHPWITFHMKKHRFESKHGSYIGYKVHNRIIDHKLKAEAESEM